MSRILLVVLIFWSKTIVERPVTPKTGVMMIAESAKQWVLPMLLDENQKTPMLVAHQD
ncbi:MAG: hypothetical protein HRU19_14105 [Pseudobacteriovorax sp.]|nr:hypothetical protein [Pseudobacteriovorax sp.]